MCMLKSAIILKDRIFCPDYDSHSKMLEELKIQDTKRNAEKVFVRAELSPKDGDIFSPVDSWILKIDQDILPAWYIEEVDFPRVVDAVKHWATNHIFCDKDNLSLSNGTYYLKNCKEATLYGNSDATLFGNSAATLYGNSTATLCGNSAATLYGNSTATLYGNSTATLCGNSTATLRGNSTATLYGNSAATLRENSAATLRENSTGIIENRHYGGSRENCVLRENSTLKDCKTKTIYQSGDWKFVAVEG